MRPSQIYQSQIDSGQLSSDTAQLQTLQALDAVYDFLTTPAPKKSFFHLKKTDAPKPINIYIWGAVGRGKTMLLDMLCQSLPSEIKKTRVHFHAFMLDLHARITNLRAQGGSDDYLGTIAKDIAAENALLCFDEFHVTNIADAMILGPLFKALFAAGICVVTTSNWPPHDLYKGGLQRVRFVPFINLIEMDMRIIPLDGTHDYRVRALEKSGTYQPNGGAHFELVFKQLIGGMPITHNPIALNGRTLPVVAQAGEIVWCNFVVLCGEPRGAADYLILAQSAKVVLLDNVPQLTDDRRDWAKRFMTLIDVLYDARRILVLGAAVPLADLYVGEDLAFEFARTHSRLLEMQSATYIAQNEQTG